MKSLYRKYASQAAIMVSCLLLGQILQSCSKESAKDPLSGDKANIMISVLGVSESGEDGDMQLKASSAIREAVKQPENISGKLLNFKAFDAVVSVEKGISPKSRLSIGNTKKNTSLANGLVAEAVEAGVKYRLLIYTQDGVFVDSQLLTSGEVEEIQVPKGNDYYWYAVSYNNADDIPAVDPTNPVLSLPGDKDVLYASGTLSIPEAASDDNIPLGIVFKHSFARVTIELNTMGMFADIVSADLSVSGNQAMTGTLDLKTGAISGLTNSTQTIDFNSFVNVEEPYADRKVAHFYTADETELDNLTVTLTGLQLALDDGSTRTFSGISSVFEFAIEPERGATYEIKVDLVESPLALAGVQWARQNLYYLGGHNPYRFHHTYAHTDARNSYFSFKGVEPLEYGTSVDGDPCALVYPEGVWRTASRDDFLRLTGNLLLPSYPKQTATYGTDGTLGFYEYQASTGTGAPYPSDNLRFNMNGGSVGIALVEDLIELDLGSSYGTSIQLWSSDPVLGVGDLIWLGANTYYGARSGSNNNASVESGILNLGVLGLDLIESSFKNVRCVRN